MFHLRKDEWAEQIACLCLNSGRHRSKLRFANEAYPIMARDTFESSIPGESTYFYGTMTGRSCGFEKFKSLGVILKVTQNL